MYIGNEYHLILENGEIKLKTKDEFLSEFKNSYKDPFVVKNQRPMTLEGCVVRISDIIGYLGRDIEDALRLNAIDEKDLPESIMQILGNKNGDIVNVDVSTIYNGY